jgi:riboflavin biosynthesis pyrimidine reductase
VELLLPSVRPIELPDLWALYDTPGPYVRAGMLSSLDGASSHAGTSRSLQPPGDGVVFAALRAVADVVLVGAGTARAEGYRSVRLSRAVTAWRSGHGRPAVPLAVVSRSLDLPLDAPWLADATCQPIVLTCGAAPADRRERLADRADVLVCGQEAVDLGQALRRLADRGLHRVLCEGGPALLGDLVRESLVTEVCATVSPLLAGDADGMLRGPLPAPVPLVLAHLLREQSTLLGRWLVQPAPVDA